ncbi:MAG: hypothetical protein SGJ20_10645 [Planctomycetota bacterium]|nr:hypothetical protein [Planctomycetota bacterium]
MRHSVGRISFVAAIVVLIATLSLSSNLWQRVVAEDSIDDPFQTPPDNTSGNKSGPSLIKPRKAQSVEAPPPSTLSVKVTNEPAKPQSEAEIQERLSRKTAILIEDLPLSQAVADIAKQAGVKVQIDTKALEETAATADSSVRLEIKDIALEHALELLLKPLDLDYYTENGILHVTSYTAAEMKLETRVYPIPQAASADDLEELSEVINTSVAPETWEQQGGSGSIKAFRRSLVISQTQRVHRDIVKLLQELQPVLAVPPLPKTPNPVPEKQPAEKQPDQKTPDKNADQKPELKPSVDPAPSAPAKKDEGASTKSATSTSGGSQADFDSLIDLIEHKSDPSIGKATAQMQTRTIVRKTPVENAPVEHDGNAKTLEKLTHRATFNISNLPLQEAITEIAKQSKLQFQIDRKGLEEMGQNEDVPVAVDISDVSLGDALNSMLHPLDLDHYVKYGIVFITSRTEMESRLDTRVYQLPDEDVEELIEAIQSTIDPTTWDVVGGNASLVPFRKSLVITQTDQAHRQIAGLLEKLRPLYDQPPLPGPKKPKQPASNGQGGMGGGMGGMM